PPRHHQCWTASQTMGAHRATRRRATQPQRPHPATRPHRATQPPSQSYSYLWPRGRTRSIRADIGIGPLTWWLAASPRTPPVRIVTLRLWRQVSSQPSTLNSIAAQLNPLARGTLGAVGLPNGRPTTLLGLSPCVMVVPR